MEDKKTAIVIFADGFEEIEALSVVDLLRRAGIYVQMLSLLGETKVTGSHGITVVMDGFFEDWTKCNYKTNSLNKKVDAIILPGGLPGTTNLRKSEKLKSFICKMNEEKKIIAAICAAPTVLNDCGILKSKKITSYPSFENEFTEENYVTDAVVESEHIITSRGVGTVLEFGLLLIEKMCSAEKSLEIKKGILYTS